MAELYNISAGDIIPQMGFSPSQNQTGGWNATRSYYMLASTWENATTQLRFYIGQPITTADPSVSSDYSFLRIESVNVVYEDSGTVLLTVNYTGAGFSPYTGENNDILSPEAKPIYRLEGRLTSISLALHPKFSRLPVDEQYALESVLLGDAELVGYRAVAPNAIDGKWEPLKGDDDQEIQISSSDGIEFADIIRDGTTTWDHPTLVWTETTDGDTPISPSVIDGLIPVIQQPRGLSFNLPNGINWMSTGITQEQKGKLYRTTTEWTSSPPGGWDETLYG